MCPVLTLALPSLPSPHLTLAIRSSFLAGDGAYKRVVGPGLGGGLFPPGPGSVYTSAPPPGTPITPGTQIILSEGMANNISVGGMARVHPVVSLPLHPLPPTSEQLGITRCKLTPLILAPSSWPSS
jgi:hypothetical protein